MSSYTDTHLCGGYTGQPWCDGFFENGDEHVTVMKENGNMKTLQPFCLYCRREGYRKIGSKGSWTSVLRISVPSRPQSTKTRTTIPSAEAPEW